MWTVRVAVKREKVIPVEGDVDADVLAAAHRVTDMAVLRGMLRLQLHADTNGGGHEAIIPAPGERQSMRQALHEGSRPKRQADLPAPSGRSRRRRGCAETRGRCWRTRRRPRR